MTCHSSWSTCVIDHINDDSVLFKCLSKSWPTGMSNTRTLNPTQLNGIVHFIIYIWDFVIVTCQHERLIVTGLLCFIKWTETREKSFSFVRRIVCGGHTGLTVTTPGWLPGEQQCRCWATPMCSKGIWMVWVFNDLTFPSHAFTHEMKPKPGSARSQKSPKSRNSYYHHEPHKRMLHCVGDQNSVDYG